MPNDTSTLTFWDHLDQLRSVLLRILLATLICSVAAFIFKDEVFRVVLAPKQADFVTYSRMRSLALALGIDATFDTGNVQLINTGLAQQFMIHLKTAFCVGILCAAPYALYALFGFISPGLYSNERRLGSSIAFWGYVMFMAGTALSYFVIFPMTFQFLGNYQVSGEVANMIDLESYMSTLIMLTLFMGLICEMPVIAWLLAKAGILSSSLMTRYRRHAVVVILSLAAIITPTSDAFTLMLVSLPMWLLYEASILITRRINRKKEISFG